MKKQCLGVLILLFLIGSVSGTFIGVAPSNEDLGQLERGERYEINIFVNTDAEERFTLNPDFETSYTPTEEVDNFSQENISQWGRFTQESYTIDPDTAVDVGDRNFSNMEGKMTLFLEIPQDAEPGIHEATVDLNPEIGSSGSTVSNLGLSRYSLDFVVPGNARRELALEGVEGLRAGESEARIVVEVKNTGTVTTFVRSSFLDVFSGSERVAEITTPGVKIAPGETKEIKAAWSSRNEDIEAGNYRLRGSMNYVTSNAFLDSSFSITDFIQIESSNQSSSILPSRSGESDDGFPLMLVVMFLVITGAIMYSFEIDPLLVVIVLGVLLGSSIVFFTNLPDISIAGILIVAAGLFYYGWM